MTSKPLQPKTTTSTKKVPRRSLPFDNPRLPKDVPILGLGCSSFSTFFWNDNDDDSTTADKNAWTATSLNRQHPIVQEWIETIRYAIQEGGINLLDTAPWYGHGTSEIVIGWALEEIYGLETKEQQQEITSTDKQHVGIPLKDRDLLVINSKVGRYEEDPLNQFDFSYQATLDSVERSLKRMHCHYLNVLQLHDAEFAPTLEVLLHETIPAMMECQRRGWCLALGMTGYPLEVQHQIIMASQRQQQQEQKVQWDQALVYSHYNLHDDSLFTRKSFDAGNGDEKVSFAQVMKSMGIVVMAAAPLSMGLLTPPSCSLAEWHPADLELRQACQRAATISEEHGVDISTLAILMALSRWQDIPCTLLGMKNVAQVKSAIQVVNRLHSDNENTLPLEKVFTSQETKVWEILRDPEKGPFARVWQNGSFRWNGVDGVRQFWNQVPSVKTTEWQCEPK